MVRNGLFLVSLGLLIFMLMGTDSATMTFINPIALGFAAILVLVGMSMFIIGAKQAKSKDEK
ncbi:MAG: hypothetical protein LBV67_01365 [Streptococcaceae bacterium]|jgi:heme/copper-type cytochrome/quinol oxidase subunit 4|nr:hypothetical protein [Streptococcaceae bacterium]